MTKLDRQRTFRESGRMLADYLTGVTSTPVFASRLQDYLYKIGFEPGFNAIITYSPNPTGDIRHELEHLESLQFHRLPAISGWATHLGLPVTVLDPVQIVNIPNLRQRLKEAQPEQLKIDHLE